MYNARVVPAVPEMAYLEVAPFSRVSAILLPIITVLYALAIVGYFWYITYAGRELYNAF